MSTNYRVHVPWLVGKGKNEHSQFGEDGLIEGCLQQLYQSGFRGTKWCFEVGANDGHFYSNTKYLRGQGWSCLLIESDGDLYEKLNRLEREAANGQIIRTVHAKATPENFNDLLGDVDYDVGSIDIDGQDYWLLNAMIARPKVLVVEFSPYVEGRFIPKVGQPGQATFEPIVELALSKGYDFVAQTYCNCVFVWGTQC